MKGQDVQVLIGHCQGLLLGRLSSRRTSVGSFGIAQGETGPNHRMPENHNESTGSLER